MSVDMGNLGRMECFQIDRVKYINPKTMGLEVTVWRLVGVQVEYLVT